MASGSFSGSHGGYTIRTDWSSTTNIEGNYSTITCNHYLVCGSGWDLYIGTRNNSCTVYGETKSFTSPAIQTGGNSTHHIGTTTHVVPHNSEGKKTTEGSTTFNMEATIGGSWVGSITTETASMVLDDIPRASTLGTIRAGTLNTNQTIKVTRNSDSFTHTLSYECGSVTGVVENTSGVKIEKSTLTSIQWKPPMSLASQNTSGTSVTIKFTLTTYNGNTVIGTNTKSAKYTIPDSVKPVCTLIVNDTEGYADTYGGYLQGLSKLNVQVIASSPYGATIKSYNTLVSNTSYTKQTFTTGIINNAGTLNISTTVTDTRERTNTASTDVTVLEYSKPKIDKDNFKVHRCNADGTENQDGDHVSVTYSCSITSLDGKNKITTKIRYKKSTASTSDYITITDVNSSTEASFVDRMVIFEADTGSSYDVELIVSDNFDSISKSTSVSTAFTFHHYKGPDTEGGGKNLIDSSILVSGYPTTEGELTNTVGSVGCMRTGLLVVKPNTTYAFSFKPTTEHEKWIGVALYSGNDVTTFIERKSTSSADTFIFTTTADTNFIAIGAHNLNGATEIQLEEGSKVTDYEPYVHAYKASMGLGKMAELEGGLDIGFYTRFNEGIKPIHLPKGADFNDYTKPNVYVCDYNFDKGEYINAPASNNISFNLIVTASGPTETVIRQEVITCSKTNSKRYERYHYSNSWGEWKETSVANLHPIGSIVVSNNTTNPSSYLGGTWVQERILYGGELIAYACVNADNSSRVSVAADTSLGFGDSRIGTKTHYINNYIDGILVAGNGAIKVDTQGIVGMVEADVTISGRGQSGLVGIWYGGNNNALPDGITMYPCNANAALKTGPTSDAYGGSSHQYLYKVEDGLDTTFAVNPKFNIYGGGIYPSCDGTTSYLIVKAYAKHTKSYMWRRTA